LADELAVDEQLGDPGRPFALERLWFAGGLESKLRMWLPLGTLTSEGLGDERTAGEQIAHLARCDLSLGGAVVSCPTDRI